MAEVDDDRLVVSPTLAIPVAELTVRTSRSGGPGGQHANTSDTRVEVVFDVAGSPSLGPGQRARLLERLGSTVRAIASDERSQARNRIRALERLGERLAEALKVDPTRHPTRPTRGSKVRRVEAKRHRSETKRLRQRPDPGD